MADQGVIREGQMYRRIGVANRSWSSWKKQWVVLRADKFSVAKSAKDKEKDWTHHMLKGCVIRRSGPFQGFPDSFSDWPTPPLDHCFEIVDAASQEHTFWVDKSADGVLWVSRFRDAITAANPGNPNCNQLSGQRAVPKVIVDATYVPPTAEWGGDEDSTASGDSRSRSSTPSSTSQSLTSPLSVKSTSASSFGSASKTPPAPVDATALWNSIKLLTEPGAIAELNRPNLSDQIAKSMQKYAEVTGADISAPDASGWTLLLDAAASQNLTLCVELLRMKANPSVRTDSGNTILHSLVKMGGGPNPDRTEKEAAKLIDYILKTRGASFLELVNAAGETALFRAVQFGNLTWTRILLQREANPFLAFVPSTRHKSHAERYRHVYAALDAAIPLYREAQALRHDKISRKSSKKDLESPTTWNLRGAQTDQLCQAIRKNPSSELRSFVVMDPLSQQSLQNLWQQFQLAAKPADSWAAMQQLSLDLDRLTLLKEREGRYYRAFDSTNEVLSSAVETVTLINSHTAPLSWEISKYQPALESWDGSTLRFELQGPRKGTLQPFESVSFKVTVLAMKATKFFQLMAVCYSEITPGAAVGWSSVGATYLLFDADIQPPAELRDFEIPANLLPPLTNPIGSGASSQVYKVANFLPTKTKDQFLAVKRFPLSLERGLAEHAEDFRRFKLELFISSRLQHPNIVKTLGFVGTPPIIVMEFVHYSMRWLIDSTELAVSPANKMKIAMGLCRGMAYLHEQGFVHRDMKPGNVLVTEQFEAKVSDFGIAMSGGNQRKSNSETEFEGTIFYMAPEVFRDKVFSKEADVYAGGITIYELIKGVDAMIEQGCTEEKSRLGFSEERIKAQYPIKTADFATLDAGMRSFLERCWAPVQRRFTFNAAVEILAAIRKEFLKHDVDQQVVDVVAGELKLSDVIRDWSTRLTTDTNIKKFRKELASSTAFPYLVEQLIDGELPSSDVATIEAFFAEYFGPAFKELPVNLRALHRILQQMVSGVRVREVRDIVIKNVIRALMPTSGNPQPLSAEQMQSWLDFVASVNKDPALRGPKRYEADRKALQEKIKKLQRNLKDLNKRVAALDSQPVMSEYLSGFMSSEEQSAVAIVEKMAAKAEEDLAKLDGHMEYKHYAAMFENPTSSEAERVAVMFGHFKEELLSHKSKLATLRSLVAKNPTILARVDKVTQRVVAIEARFPAHAFTEKEDKPEKEKSDKPEREKDKADKKR